MTIKFFSILMLLSPFFFSCKKFLDIKPDNSLTVPDNLVALQALLDNASYMNATNPSTSEASADDYFLTDQTYKSLIPVVQQSYIWNLAGRADYTFASADWAKLYLIVFNANICLDELPKIKKTIHNTDSWNNIKGAALFFRARSFLYLSWLFSKAYHEQTADNDLGIVLRIGSNFNVPSKRASVEESYRQIIHDFKEAIDFLPDQVSNPLRPGKLAAYGYLARTYLSMRVYDSAFKYADLCLKQNDELMDFNDPNVIKIENSYSFTNFNKEIIHLDYNNSSVMYSLSYANIDSSLYDSYDSFDLRKQAYFTKPVGDKVQFKGSYTGGNAFFTGIATDEIYFILAECYARSGKIDNALSSLNTVLRTRWKSGSFVPFLTADKDEALQVILSERRKELVLRNLRWIDIKRLNLEGANISIKRVIEGKEYILLPNDKRFAIPLPTDIINITGMPQNGQ